MRPRSNYYVCVFSYGVEVTRAAQRYFILLEAVDGEAQVYLRVYLRARICALGGEMKRESTSDLDPFVLWRCSMIHTQMRAA